MPVVDLTIEQVIELVKQLSPEDKKAVLEVLQAESTTEHPWLKLAGKYQDDPHFEQMLAEIEAERKEIDAQQQLS